MKYAARMLVSALALFGIAYVSQGALLGRMEFWPTAVVAALVLSVVNAVVKPVAKVLTLPVTILTLGLFSLVVNAAMFYIVDRLVPGFETVGFVPTVVAALIMAIVNAVASDMTD